MKNQKLLPINLLQHFECPDLKVFKLKTLFISISYNLTQLSKMDKIWLLFVIPNQFYLIIAKMILTHLYTINTCKLSNLPMFAADSSTLRIIHSLTNVTSSQFCMLCVVIVLPCPLISVQYFGLLLFHTELQFKSHITSAC